MNIDLVHDLVQDFIQHLGKGSNCKGKCSNFKVNDQILRVNVQISRVNAQIARIRINLQGSTIIYC
jgi:hypothetical protein